MRYFLLLGLALMVASGCKFDALNKKSQESKLQQEQLAAANTMKDYQSRISSLDASNSQVHSDLAQSQHQAKLLQEQLNAVQTQLRDTTQKLADSQEYRTQSEQQIKAMNASLERRGSITIEPNSSIKRSLPMINLPNFKATKVDNVIRITVPADQLFADNDARLRPGADRLLNQLSAELRRLYPHQIIGIEGHTDQRPPLGNLYRNPHELSVAWAIATQAGMVHYGGMPAAQLFVVGYGDNRPQYSNGTTGTEPRNRRIEFVVYPEMFGG